MKKTVRQAYHHGDLRATLLRAALQLLDEQGPDGVLIREVARRAGVSHAAPANHFPDRRSLLTALATEQFDVLEKQVETVLQASEKKVADRIRRFADGVMDFGLTWPNRYRLLWRRDLLDLDDLKLNAVMDRIYNHLITELSRAENADSHDPHTAAIALWSLVHGYLSMRLDGMFEPRKDAVSGEARDRAIVSLLIHATK